MKQAIAAAISSSPPQQQQQASTKGEECNKSNGSPVVRASSSSSNVSPKDSADKHRLQREVKRLAMVVTQTTEARDANQAEAQALWMALEEKEEKLKRVSMELENAR